jgi:subtilisin
MATREWTRRDLLKSAGTGVVGAAVGGAVLARLGPYIVGASGDGGVAAAASVSERQHARIDLTEHTATTLVRGVYSEARCEALRAREDVAFVQPDRRLTYVGGSDGSPDVGTRTQPWGIDRVDADVAHAAGARGAGADVAVVDGGIDDAHPDLAGPLADPDGDGAHSAWVDCGGADCNYPWSDEGGHGTHVAGTVAADGTAGVVGVAPEATLHALKVCGADGGCRTSAVVEAIRYAADRGWDVVNLSLGNPNASPALRTAGRYALEAGVLPVAAAGNRGAPDSVGYPAAYDEFLAVSATDIEDGVADFSSRGPEVDLAAPGQGVCSSTVGGYRVLDGTSMAAPHVAGGAALLVGAGHAPLDARDRLLETAENLGMTGDEQGAGLVDVAAALGYDSADDGTGDGTRCPS